MKITAILFDLGDTLFDLTSYTCFARTMTIEKLIDQGIPITNVNEAQRLFEKVIQKNAKAHADRLFLNDFFFSKFLEEIGIKDNPMVSKIAHIMYRDTISSFITPSSAIIQTLSSLKAKGYKRGVITDGSINTTYEILLRLAIKEFFDVIVVSEEVGVEKPNPKIFSEATAQLKTSSTETIMVGDNLERDILGGKQAGMTTVLMERHRPGGKEKLKIKPDFTIQRLNELVNILSVEN
jgi:putative hydrolase of the HAD superfamily